MMKKMVYGSVITAKMMCIAIMNASDSIHIFNRHLWVDDCQARLYATRNKSHIHGVFDDRFYDAEDVMNAILDFFDACGYENFMEVCKRMGRIKTLQTEGEVKIPIPCKNAGLVYFEDPEKAPVVANKIRLVFKIRESGLFNDPTGAKGLYLATAYPVL